MDCSVWDSCLLPSVEIYLWPRIATFFVESFFMGFFLKAHEILLFFLLLPEPHCPKPAVDHGREAYNSKNDYTVGTKVRIECDEGYTLSTQQLVTCQADGNWFPSLPYCQKGTCKAGAVISTGAGQAAFLQHHPWGAGR